MPLQPIFKSSLNRELRAPLFIDFCTYTAGSEASFFHWQLSITRGSFSIGLFRLFGLPKYTGRRYSRYSPITRRMGSVLEGRRLNQAWGVLSLIPSVVFTVT